MDILHSPITLSAHYHRPSRFLIRAMLMLSLACFSVVSQAESKNQVSQKQAQNIAKTQNKSSAKSIKKPAQPIKSANTVRTQQKSIEQRALNTVKQSFKAYVGENKKALLALYHPQSSLRQETAEVVQAYFDENKLIGELVETKYLSHDKEYVYVTARVITRDVGPNIRLSKYERDILFILKPYGNRYLIWILKALNNPVLNETTF